MCFSPLLIVDGVVQLVERYYGLAEVPDGVLDAVRGDADTLLCCRPDAIDAVLVRVDAEKVPIDVAIALLTLTAARKSELTQYVPFYAKVLMRLSFKDGPETAAETLRGLEP